MRYPFVLACFALVLFAAACTLDDGDESNDAGATAVEGRDIVLDIGVARVEISGLSIGPGAGQIPAGSKLKLKVVDQDINGRDVYSPVIELSVKDGAGAPVTGLALNPPAVVELSYNSAAAAEEGDDTPDKLNLLKIDGGTTDELAYTTLSPAPDTEFTLAYKGRTRALVTGFSRFAVAGGASGGGGGPGTPTALTGTVSTVVTATVFQLADTGAVFSVNLAVPTSITTTVPAVVTLNDASFNAGSPLDPNNRVVTVQTGGTTYTSDAPAASVVFQLNVFTGSSSSGSLLGTVIEQGGSASLAINFTFTTGTPLTDAVGGTVTELGGFRTLNLQDAGQTEQVVILMPDTLPNAMLDPITFDETTFDSGNPTAATSRVVTVTEGGETYSSDVPFLGSVTVTFTSWDDLTLSGAGTITGTVVSATPASKVLNYTFTVSAGGGGGGGGFSAGTPVDITTTDVADEAAIHYDDADGDYIAVWMSDIGTTNRTLEIVSLNPDTFAQGAIESYEPTAAIVPGGGMGLASDDFENLAIACATSTNAIAIFYAYDGVGLRSEVDLGAGSATRVAYNPDDDSFIFAWQSGADVMIRTFNYDGTALNIAQTAISGATLTGLCAADTDDEALVTGDDGSGIVGQLITVSTGVLSGAGFDLSTSLGGGLCEYDPVGDNYLINTQQLVQGFFTAQVLIALAPGTTVPVGGSLTLAAAAAPTQSCFGNAGVIFADPGANMYPVDSGLSGPSLVDQPLFGALNGLNIDTTADGGDLAGAGSNRYVLIAARGADGVTVIPLTLTP
ncbi:MAG: hypothetical protein K8I27_02445 [Planctomycetes bacterium]|nr:hypothetical protein [Planctomycetota bacterium]